MHVFQLPCPGTASSFALQPKRRTDPEGTSLHTIHDIAAEMNSGNNMFFNYLGTPYECIHHHRVWAKKK